MLKSIGIKNFKSISNANVSLANLTLLSGANGSGKSSLIQGLLLLKQSDFADDLTTIVLNGDYCRLGQMRNIEYNWSTENDGEVKTILTYTSKSTRGDEKNFSIELAHDREDNRDVVLNPPVASSDRTFVNMIHYLSADRLVPSDTFPYSTHQIDKGNLGVRGQYAIAFLAKNKLAPLDIESLIHPDSLKYGVASSLIANVQAWMQAISPGVQIAPTLQQKLNASVLEYGYAGGVSDINSFNVGFGITYVLPVIVRILMSKPGDIVVLDNPEAHVHPRGQVELGRLIALAANSKVQMIVETHSDHLFNGIRLHIKESEISPKLEYKMYYVDRVPCANAEVGSFETHFSEIELAEDAKIVSAPSGFFDEWENAIFRLL